MAAGEDSGSLRAGETVVEHDGDEREPAPRLELPRGGEMLGRYSVLDTIGSGGMGVVLAAYDRKLDRKVALKLLRTDKTGDGARRMLREAKLLGQLQHENVVTVFGVGTYQGQVYIAMEYVEGTTLDAWITAESPRWPEILDVVIRAGRGLAAAHAAGLVHRDFKPANVLVGARPSSGPRAVRVVDFGIAIVASGPGTEPPPDVPVDSLDGGTDLRASEPLTETGALLGTPAYMAPEQHLGRGADAASDQFSFCVALYRSLYGERPFAGRTLRALRNEVLRGRVRAAPVGSRVPRWLRRIVVRGLEADPRRRFSSMAALLDELQRTKAARRRIPLASAAVGGLVLATWALVVDVAPVPGPRCDDGRRRLEGAWDDSRREAVAAAFAASDLSYAPDAAQRVSRQLDDWAERWSTAHTEACVAGEHAGADGSEALDAHMTCLRRRLAEVAALTEELAAADDAVIERATAALGELPPLGACADAARGRTNGGAPRPPPEVEAEVESVREVLVAFDAAHSAGRFERALELADAALARAEATGFLPLVAQCRWRLGMALLSLGRLDDAEEALGTATLDAIAARDDEAAVRGATKLAFVVGYRQARPDEGLAWARHAEAALERVGEESLLEADLLGTLGAIRMSRGELAQARVAFERALELRIARLGADHPHVAAVHNNLGSALVSLGELDGARAHLERALEIWEHVHGPDHPHFATGLTGLGIAYEKLGELEAARRVHERAVKVKERAFGPEHDSVATSLDNLASVLIALGEYDASREPSLRALQIREKVLGPDHPHVASSLVNLGLADERQGRHERAVDVQSRAVRIFETALGADHPFVAHPLTSLGRSQLARGDVRAARQTLQRALQIRERTGASAPERAETRSALALALNAEPK